MAQLTPGDGETLSQQNSFAQYKHWIDFYSKKSGINLIIDETLPAPAAVPDNSQQDIATIIVNPTLLKDKIHLDDEGVLQVLFHEIEHLKEDTALKSTASGRAIAGQRQTRFKQHGVFAKTYHELENMLRDIYVNNQVVDAKNTPVLDSALRKNYAEHFAKNSDFLNFPIHDASDHTKIVGHKALPKHTQFGYAMLRESMLPQEQCNVTPDVRKAINRIKKSGVLQKASTGPLENRLQNIRKFVEPMYTKFLEEDIEQQEKNKDSNNSGNSNEQESNSQNKDNQGDTEQQNEKNSTDTPAQNSQNADNKEKPQQGENDNKGDNKQNSKKQEPQNTQDTDKNQEKHGSNEQSQDAHSSKQKKKSLIEQAKDKLRKLLSREDNQDNDNLKTADSKQSDKNNTESAQPKNPFDDIYTQLPSSPHLLEESLSQEDYEKLKEAIKSKMEKDTQPPKTAKQLEIEQRANKVREKDKTQSLEDVTQQLTEYDRFYDKLEQVRNPHTGNTVMEDIEQLFRYIRSHRLKPQIKARGPVDMDHSIGKLHNPSIASGLAQLLGGNIEAPLWEEHEKKERSKNHIGRFDISIIADGSGSMEGEKNRQQKINVLLIFEALKRLHDMLESEKRDLTEPVEFHTDGYMFKDAAHGVNYIKELSDDFTDEQRLKTYRKLDYDDGQDTNDYDALARLNTDIDTKPELYHQDILTKKLKRIVFVLTDGGSSNVTKSAQEIKKLRDRGVLVYGIGITQGGAPVLSLFGETEHELGFGKVCDKPEELAGIILDLLSPHLKQ